MIISVSRRLVILPVLIEKIREKLARKEQVVLMLNRRGYSSLSCVVIVGVLTSVPTVIFPDAPHGHKTMNCHYCGFQKGILRPVQTVKVVPFVIMGRVRKRPTMNCRILPEARILRMDVDTTKKKGAHEDLLERFGRGEADILLGTQMIAKGLDFPNVTLVGVLNADTTSICLIFGLLSGPSSC